MRILITIPHYFKENDKSQYGSGRSGIRRRVESLTRALSLLHAHFGHRQALLHSPQREALPANEAASRSVSVVLCTTGNDHLVNELPEGLFEHANTDAPPLLLGYECHARLRQGLGRYHFFGFLEDDIAIHDPMFFNKLAWFSANMEPYMLLQPNRYELAHATTVRKLYIDGEPVDTAPSRAVQDCGENPSIEGLALGRPVRFQRVQNTHSGCFFLNQRQMQVWAGKPYFLDRATSFYGPLESAASLGITRCFKVYKPSRENANFLEVEHLDHRYLGNRVLFS